MSTGNPSRVPLGVGQIWESRHSRRDGTRERVEVVAINGREATFISENPRPPNKARRTVGILIEEVSRVATIGGMQLAALADGRRVIWGPGDEFEFERMGDVPADSQMDLDWAEGAAA